MDEELPTPDTLRRMRERLRSLEAEVAEIQATIRKAFRVALAQAIAPVLADFELGYEDVIVAADVLDVEARQGRPLDPTVSASEQGAIDWLRTAQTRASQALESGATHLLWCDDDMVFPHDAALRLLAHDLPVIGCNYVKRSFELEPVACYSMDERVISLGKTGVEEVHSTGFGFIMFKREVFEDCIFPWFGHRWFYKKALESAGSETTKGIPEPGLWASTFEDAYFLKRVREAGYKIMIDHDLSLQIGHYGGCVFMHDGVALP